MQQTQRSKEEMTNEHGPFFFRALSGNSGQFSVRMDWTNPPTEADVAEIQGCFEALTVPEHDPPAPLKQLEPTAGDVRLARSEQTGPGAMERPYQIDIDARHSVIHQPEAKAPRRATCANCGIRYEITDDPIENHHRAMRHKDVCGKGSAIYTEPQRAQLLEEFQNQPMQRLFRERAAAELAAGADPDMLAITGVSILTPAPQPERPQITAAEDDAAVEKFDALMNPRRWWQFWRWFE
jgi:hypothetical protein